MVVWWMWWVMSMGGFGVGKDEEWKKMEGETSGEWKGDTGWKWWRKQWKRDG